ncbi:MAG: glycosyltransferase [Clostridia bacterium]|nr:glycosyltransferase [Clostridia bacterium]
MKEIVLIPAYKPDKEMCSLAKDLNTRGFDVLIVNDGSGAEYDETFNTAARYATVISHEQNKGKGRALKTGIEYIRDNCKECKFFITADADGQHRADDIVRVKEELKNGSTFVLTTRLLNRNIPKRSKFGNDLSRVIYTLSTGRYFKDNQSGLRGFSTENIDWLLKVKGEKYDYEMNMLYYASKQAIPVTTLDIEAVYIDGNKSSHFNPVKDTVRIYRLLLSSAKASIITAILAQIAIFVCGLVTDVPYDSLYVVTAGLAAAVTAYLINRFFIFNNVDFRDGGRTMLFALFRYMLYGLGTAVITSFLPFIPLFIAFNFCALLGLPIRYFAHKYISAFN